MNCSCGHPLSSHYAAYSSPQGDGTGDIRGKHGFKCPDCKCWLDEWPKVTDQGELFHGD